MQRSEKRTGEFPMDWEDSWCKLPEYEIISKLVESPPTTVKEAVDAIVQITEKVIDTLTVPGPELLDSELPDSELEELMFVVKYDWRFEPPDALSEHVLLVFGSVCRIASRTDHRDKAFTNLLDFLDELFTREVKASDEASNKYMEKTYQCIWLDTVKTLDHLINRWVLDDEFATCRPNANFEHLDNRVALAARLCDRLSAANPPEPALNEVKWIPPMWTPPYNPLTAWANTALLMHIAPVVQNVYLGNPAIVIAQEDPEGVCFDDAYRVKEPLLRAACIWFLYNSTQIYALSLAGEDLWRRIGRDPATMPLDRWGFTSWNYWRSALETYLGAQRPAGNRFMEGKARLSGDAKKLIKEAVVAMDRAEVAGGTHQGIDWEGARDRREKERAEKKARAEARGEEWDSGDDSIFDDWWYPGAEDSDSESGSEGEEEEEEEEDEIHHSDEEEGDGLIEKKA